MSPPRLALLQAVAGGERAYRAAAAVAICRGRRSGHDGACRRDWPGLETLARAAAAAAAGALDAVTALAASLALCRLTDRSVRGAAARRTGGMRRRTPPEAAAEALAHVLGVIAADLLVARCGRPGRAVAAPGWRGARASTSRPAPHSRSNRTSASGLVAPSTASMASAPFWRMRSSGSRPSGRKAKRRLLPATRCGSAVSMARKAAFLPALSPSKQRIGSGAMRQSSFSLILGERGAERGDALVEAGGGQRHHVHVAFDRDDAAAVVGGRAGLGGIEEDMALVEQRCFRRVQVLGRRVGVERAAAEGDDPALQVGDRKHHAIAEAVIGDGNVGAADQHARRDHLVVGVAELGEMVLQRVAAVAARSRCGSARRSRWCRPRFSATYLRAWPPAGRR